MNFGTKLRTVLRVATSINNALCVTSVAINNFEIGWLTMIWVALTIATDFVVSAITTYYNNDFTPEGEAGTKLTAYMKSTKDFRAEIAEEPEDAEVK